MQELWQFAHKTVLSINFVVSYRQRNGLLFIEIISEVKI